MPNLDQTRVRASIRLDQLGTKIRALGPKLKAALERGALEAAMRIQAQVQVEIAVSDPVPVDTGIYAAAWKAVRIPGGAMVYNDTPQSVWVERGRRAAGVSKEGQEAIARWVYRKGLYLGALDRYLPKDGPRRPSRAAVRDAAERACADIAFAITRKLALYGYPARFPLLRAIRAVDVGALILNLQRIQP